MLSFSMRSLILLKLSYMKNISKYTFNCMKFMLQHYMKYLSGGK